MYEKERKQRTKLSTQEKTQSLFWGEAFIKVKQLSFHPGTQTPCGQIVDFDLGHHNWLVSPFVLPFPPWCSLRGDAPHSGGCFVFLSCLEANSKQRLQNFQWWLWTSLLIFTLGFYPGYSKKCSIFRFSLGSFLTPVLYRPEE